MQPLLFKTGTGLPLVRIIGFAGHRHLQNPDAVSKALRAELTSLQKKEGELIAMSSIASGADTLFAEEVLRAGIKWIVLLPMAEEMFREDFTAEEWARAKQLIAQASEVRVLSGKERPQVYVDCGKATVDDSDYLLALWDGKPAQGPGGTAEMVAYAKTMEREITLLREGGTGVEKVDSSPVENAKHPPEDILETIGPTAKLPPPPPSLVEYFKTADEVATRTAPNFRRNTLRMAAFHLAATLIAGLSLSMHALHFLPFLTIPLAALKVILVFLVLWILISLRRTHAHEIWLQQRLTAEYCRSILATWHCRNFIEPVSFQEVPEIRELARSSLFLRLEKDPSASVDLKAFRSAYAHERVMTQLEYFQVEAEKAEAKAGPLRTRYWIYTFSAFLFSGFLLGLLLFNPAFANDDFTSISWPLRTLIVLLDVSPLAFPALAAFTLSRMAIEDVDRRIGRFHDLREKMHLTLIDLSYCGSWESLGRSVAKTEKILFNEVLEWHSISRYSATT
jgi:hypothetical protein